MEEVVGRLLNHTPLSITGHRYVRPSLETLRLAMETICGELPGALIDAPHAAPSPVTIQVEAVA